MVLERLPQQIQIDSLFRVGREDELATIAALRDMMCHVHGYHPN